MSSILRKFQNVEIMFSEPDFPFVFKCVGRNLDDCLVWIYADDGYAMIQLAYLEGYFHVDDIMPRVLKNINFYSDKLLYNLYNMVRCKREFSRTENENYWDGYLFFLEQAKIEWNKSKS